MQRKWIRGISLLVECRMVFEERREAIGAILYESMGASTRMADRHCEGRIMQDKDNRRLDHGGG